MKNETIYDLLPEIMRRLHGHRPVPAALQGLTFGQFRALHFVTDQRGCTMGELARALGVTLGAATGLVNRLCLQHLVSRVADPEDRRVVRLRLTDVGRRTHLSAVRGARRRLARALTALSSQEQRDIAAALVLLRDALPKRT